MNTSIKKHIRTIRALIQKALPGAEVDVKIGAKNLRVAVAHGGRSVTKVMSVTPANQRTTLNEITRIKRALREAES